MVIKKTNKLNIVFILLIIIENITLFYIPNHGEFNQTLNATCFFLASLSFGMLLIYKFYNKPVLIAGSNSSISNKKYVTLSLFTLGALAGVFFLFNIINKTDYSGISDIIPIVTTLCKRLLSGQNPYSNDALVSLYYHAPSGYLPMHWMPYTIAEFFHFDYRIITFLIWCISSFVITLRSSKINPLWLQYLIQFMMIGTFCLMAYKTPRIIGVTVEPMVAGYYMLFIFSLNQKNLLLTGFIISCCLLSRYYVALWLPLWAFILVLSGNRKEFFKISAFIILFVAVLYIIPFLSKDWSSFYTAYLNNYEVVPFGEWHHLDKFGRPYSLYNGAGFAHLFYEHYLATDLHKGFVLLKNIFIIANVSGIVLLGVFYWFKKSKINYKIFLMGSFKIFLSIFLAFIVVPYAYLMITSIFVSIAIFIEQARYDVVR